MYKIVITREIVRDTLIGGDWETIEETYPEGKDKPEKKYGRTPQVKAQQHTMITVLEQQVETLDLPRVIAAVNGLELAGPAPLEHPV